MVITRIERTNHIRDRWDYEVIIRDIETGIPRDIQNTPGVKSPQNVKVKLRFNMTMECENPNNAENRTGGGTVEWFRSLKAVTTTASQDVVGSGSYTDLFSLRGERIDDYKLKSVNMTFKNYINYQMLTVKELGMRAVAIDFVDYEVMPESKGYIDALANLAKSEAVKQKSLNDKASRENLLAPIISAAKEIVESYRDAAIKVREQPDMTVVDASANLKQLKVLGSISGGSDRYEETNVKIPDFQTIVNILTAEVAAAEANINS